MYDPNNTMPQAQPLYYGAPQTPVPPVPPPQNTNGPTVIKIDHNNNNQ